MRACQMTLQVRQQGGVDVVESVRAGVEGHLRVVEVVDTMRRVVKVRDQAIQVLMQTVEVLEHVSRYTSPVHCGCKSARSVALLFVMVHVSASGR